MERQLDARRRRAARARDGGARRRRPARAQHGGDRRRRRPARRRRGASPPTSSSSRSASGRRSTLARDAGLNVERGIVVDDALATSHPQRARGRRVRRSTAASCTASSRRSTSRRRSPRRRSAGDDAAYAGSIPTAKLKVMGVDLVCAGDPDGARAVVVADDAHLPQARRRRARAARSARSCSATRAAPSCCSTRSAPAARRPTRSRCSPRPRQATAADLPDSARRSATATASARARSSTRSARAASARRSRSSPSRAPAPAAARASRWSSELLAIERGGAAEEATYLCPCRRQTREELAAVVRERGLESRQRARAPPAAPAASAAPASPASPTSSPRSTATATARSATRASSTTASTRTSRTTARSPSSRASAAASPRADELRRIADVADQHEVPLIKITGGQRIDLLGIRKEQLPAIWEELGMPSGHAYAKAVRTVKTCVGTDFCRFGLGDAMGVGIELERADGGPLHAAQGQVGGHRLPAQLRRGLRQGHRAGRGRGRLGALRRRRRRARPCARATCSRRSTTSDEAIRLALAFLQHYRESAEYLERTYAYLERVGLEAVRDGGARATSGRAARALPDRQGRGRPRPVARAPRPRPPEAVRRARLRAALVGPPAEGVR